MPGPIVAGAVAIGLKAGKIATKKALQNFKRPWS